MFDKLPARIAISLLVVLAPWAARWLIGTDALLGSKQDAAWFAFRVIALFILPLLFAITVVRRQSLIVGMSVLCGLAAVLVAIHEIGANDQAIAVTLLLAMIHLSACAPFALTKASLRRLAGADAGRKHVRNTPGSRLRLTIGEHRTPFDIVDVSAGGVGIRGDLAALRQVATKVGLNRSVTVEVGNASHRVEGRFRVAWQRTNQLTGTVAIGLEAIDVQVLKAIEAMAEAHGRDHAQLRLA